MKKLYLIALGATINRDAAVKRLEQVSGNGPWFYSIPNTICIYSENRATDIFNLLHDPTDAKENLFVTEVPAANSMGWIPQAHCNLIAQNSIVHDYTLNFIGYWVDGRQMQMPERAGIYCVYTCNVRSDQQLEISRLLYIGKAENIKARNVNHERHDDWKRYCGPGETLCFSCAELQSKSLDVCESALIFKHKPVCNDQLKDGFYRSPTHIVTTGANLYLSPDFIVYKTVDK